MIHIPRSIPAREAIPNIAPNADKLSPAAEGIHTLLAEVAAAAVMSDKLFYLYQTCQSLTNKHT